MRPVSPELAASLAAEAATLARCWTVTRRDGQVLGFTDHDRDLILDGVTHRATSALDGSEAKAELGFATDGLDVIGALQDAAIRDADIAAGRYDAAQVVFTLVDWRQPERRIVLGRYEIGEIARSDTGFTAELRSLAHRHDEERGRLYTVRCDADLGDARCGAQIAPVSISVSAIEGRASFATTGLAALTEGHFSGGKASFVSGANAGAAIEIRRHRRAGSADWLDLWIDAALPIAVGDQLTLTPGCDKTFGTCRSRFGNGLNFQGFPHIPGSDFLLQRAAEGEPVRFDGGSLFR